MISDKSYVHPNAKIGSGVTIEPFAYIDDNVEIGDGCWIGPNASIFNHARIGNNTKIFPGAVISAVPQDLKFKGEDALTIIGSNCTIRECVTVNRGTVDKMRTEVGDNTLLMAYVHVAHDCIIGKNCIIANSVNLAGHITIEDNVNIGGMTAVQQFLRIGKYSFIGGGSLVRKEVPPFVKAAKEPLSFMGINSIGLSRKGFSSEEIADIQNMYRSILGSEGNVSIGVKKAAEIYAGNPNFEYIRDFISTSKFGVIRSAIGFGNSNGD